MQGPVSSRTECPACWRPADVGLLANPNQLPFVSTFTCTIAAFANPGFDSLGEELVIFANAGATTLWGPTGLGFSSDTAQLNEIFFNVLRNQTILGDAVVETLRIFENFTNAREVRLMFQIIGDPSVKVR